MTGIARGRCKGANPSIGMHGTPCGWTSGVLACLVRMRGEAKCRLARRFLRAETLKAPAAHPGSHPRPMRDIPSEPDGAFASTEHPAANKRWTGRHRLLWTRQAPTLRGRAERPVSRPACIFVNHQHRIAGSLEIASITLTNQVLRRKGC